VRKVLNIDLEMLQKRKGLGYKSEPVCLSNLYTKPLVANCHYPDIYLVKSYLGRYTIRPYRLVVLDQVIPNITSLPKIFHRRAFWRSVVPFLEVNFNPTPAIGDISLFARED